jgi:hypothetical protein
MDGTGEAGTAVQAAVRGVRWKQRAMERKTEDLDAGETPELPGRW